MIELKNEFGKHLVETCKGYTGNCKDCEFSRECNTLKLILGIK